MNPIAREVGLSSGALIFDRMYDTVLFFLIFKELILDCMRSFCESVRGWLKFISESKQL